MNRPEHFLAVTAVNVHQFQALHPIAGALGLSLADAGQSLGVPGRGMTPSPSRVLKVPLHEYECISSLWLSAWRISASLLARWLHAGDGGVLANLRTYPLLCLTILY